MIVISLYWVGLLFNNVTSSRIMKIIIIYLTTVLFTCHNCSQVVCTINTLRVANFCPSGVIYGSSYDVIWGML